ncbi:TPA: hypothetical protein DCX15_03230 [bacterium]|nr:hypothetical protein [bacterium]
MSLPFPSKGETLRSKKETNRTLIFSLESKFGNEVILRFNIQEEELNVNGLLMGLKESLSKILAANLLGG